MFEQNLVSHHVRGVPAAGRLCSRWQGKMVIYAFTDRGRELLEMILAGRVSV